MKNYKKDLYRYYGEKGETLKNKLKRPLEIRYIILLRKLKNCKNKIVKVVYRFRLRKLGERSHIAIFPETQIGEGLYIGHTGRVIVNFNAVLGKNVNLSTGVTIGAESRGIRKGAPTIGNRVWIGTNAVIVGNISIGDDVMIAPNAFVNFDVPAHSIVLGNPAKIISRDNATEGYILNEVE